ncbi:MAG: hypothetical protein D6819_03545 [Gammaproteobacteria bacterium]|nr:MAG: hypothetical protein D6819_03545 [Gammaproteobacteria bacterium]
MAESGLHDFALAKRKAAAGLGFSDPLFLPSNWEVEQALMDYQRLFQSHHQPQALDMRRELAIQSMEFFAPFQPRLVGAVLSGTAGEYSDIQLHLFSDPPEAVALFLMEHRIPYQEGDKRLRINRDTFQSYPFYRFAAQNIGIELIVFAVDDLHHPPLSPVDGKPMRRASIDAVRRLLEKTDG